MKNCFSRFLTTNRPSTNGAAVIILLVVLSLGCGYFRGSETATNVNSGERNEDLRSSQNTNARDLTGVASPTTSVQPIPPVPKPQELIALVQETTADLSNAMMTGDFSAAYANMSPEFQQNVSEQKFKDSFMRDIEKTNLTPALLAQLAKKDIVPAFTAEPYTARNVNVRTGALSTDKLVVKGTYKTQPRPTSFAYEYLMVDGKWKAKKVML